MFERNRKIRIVVKRQGQRFEDTPVSPHLIVEGRLAIGRRNIDRRKNPGRSLDELLRERCPVAAVGDVGPEQEIRLQTGHILTKQVKLGDHRLELVAAEALSGARLGGIFGPGFNAWRRVVAVALRQTRESRRLQDRKRAFHQVAVATAARDFVDDVHRAVEAYGKIRIVIGHHDLREVFRQERQIGEQLVSIERDVFRIPVDAKVAIVGTSDARQHRDCARGLGPAFMEGGQFDVGQTLFDRRKLRRRVGAGDDGGRIDPAAQDVVEKLSVALAHDNVEKPAAVRRKGPRVRPAGDRQRSPTPEGRRNRIGERAGLRVCADKHDVDVVG